MATETYPKKGPHGGKSFDTVMFPGTWDDHDNSKRDRSKSGRNEYAGKAQSNYKFKVGKESPGNTSRREYPKKGNSAQGGFGTGA